MKDNIVKAEVYLDVYGNDTFNFRIQKFYNDG